MMNQKTSVLLTAKWLCLYLIIGLTGAGCTNTAHLPTVNNTADSLQARQIDPVYSVFLIGDTGEATLKPREPVLVALEKQLEKSGKQSTVVFLGDNIYPSGLPAESADSRERTERRLRTQLKTVENYAGRIIFLPGNHDWNSSNRKGLQRIRRQERYIENYLQKGNTFLPDSGYPGPVSVSLNASTENSAGSYPIQLVVLDTQWWLHPYKKPFSAGIKSEKRQKEKILEGLKERIHRYKNSEVIVAGHHPMVSYGRHGGYFPLRTHFIPPVLGSMYVAYRNIRGYHQDIANYDDLKSRLMEILESKNGLIYASGHEHSLQFIPHLSGGSMQYYIISGSATRPSYVKKLDNHAFTSREKGFVAIRYFSDRSKRIEMWNNKGTLIFQEYIKHRPVE